MIYITMHFSEEVYSHDVGYVNHSRVAFGMSN